MGFLGKNVRGFILESTLTVWENNYKFNYLENLTYGEEKCIHIMLKGNRRN